MSQYFPKLYEPFGGDINVKVDLSNYAAKSDLNNATGVDTSKLAAKSNLASLKAKFDKFDVDKSKNVPTNLSNLKSKVDTLDIDKLLINQIIVPADLSELSNVVKNDAINKDVDNAKIKSIGVKMPDITNLAIKTTLNAKINEVKGEIPCITNLTTTTALTTVENEIPNVSNLIKKTDYKTNVN